MKGELRVKKLCVVIATGKSPCLWKAMFCNSDQDFPACLSKRDVDFLKKEMGEVFKKAKYAVKEIYTAEGVLDFSLFECIESDDISSKQRDRMNKDR